MSQTVLGSEQEPVTAAAQPEVDRMITRQIVKQWRKAFHDYGQPDFALPPVTKMNEQQISFLWEEVRPDHDSVAWWKRIIAGIFEDFHENKKEAFQTLE